MKPKPPTNEYDKRSPDRTEIAAAVRLARKASPRLAMLINAKSEEKEKKDGNV